MPDQTDPSKKTILFDWGNTLMKEIPGYSGPMVDWPRLETVQGAAETLARLTKDYRLALATNAVDSTEDQIWQALQRGGLAEFIDRVFCFHTTGAKKPSPEFYTAVLQNLGVTPGETLMVGDSLETDVLGAVRSGLKAVWLNEVNEHEIEGPGFGTIHRLLDLPAAVLSLFQVDENPE